MEAWGVVALGVSLGGIDATVLGDLARGDPEGLGIAGVVVGTLQLLAGVGIIPRTPSARIMIALGVISVLLNFGYHRVLEGWAFTGLVLNLAIIVILATRHDEFR